MNSILHYLDKLKPLWDFLTAVGTLSAVAVSLWFATRKPKARFELFATPVNEDKTVLLTITNKGETSELVLGWYWRAPCIAPRGGIGLQDYPAELNGAGALRLPQRMNKFDVLVVFQAIESMATQANGDIASSVTSEEIKRCVDGSRLGCDTSSGRRFEIALPERLAELITRRLQLLRQVI